VTVPVAEEDATVAVRVTVSATVGAVVEAERVVVVEVVEDFQKSPQPDKSGVTASVSERSAVPTLRGLCFIESPCS
jgi:hypothetical protein